MILDDFLINFYGILQYISLIVAILFYKKYKNYTFYNFFVLYLVNIIVFDILAKTIFEKDNFSLFNYYTFFEFNFFALIYYALIKEKSTLTFIKILVIIFNAIYFISFIYDDLTKYTVLIEGIFNSIFIILYFKELLNSDSILNYKKLLPFWISVGFLLFYLTSIPFFTLLYSGFFNSRTMFPILYSLIIVFNLCFIYGLITCKKTEG
jgi:hypothetical protein